MTFNSAEISNQDGQPLALYHLKYGEIVWAYTSADRVVTYGGVDYQPVAVLDSGMTQGGSSLNDLTIDAPSNLPICALFRGTPPSGSIFLTVRRIHYGEADAPIYWKGTVTTVKRTGPADAQIIGQPLTSSFKRTGLRLCWTRECPHFLYDPGCKVDPEDYRFETTIGALTGIAVTVAGVGGAADGYYTGGYMEWEVEVGTTERRMIEKHEGTTLTLMGLTTDLEVGLDIALFPGCDRTPATCDTKFSNIPNYGGFTFMPGESPYGVNLF